MSRSLFEKRIHEDKRIYYKKLHSIVEKLISKRNIVEHICELLRVREDYRGRCFNVIDKDSLDINTDCDYKVLGLCKSQESVYKRRHIQKHYFKKVELLSYEFEKPAVKYHEIIKKYKRLHNAFTILSMKIKVMERNLDNCPYNVLNVKKTDSITEIEFRLYEKISKITEQSKEECEGKIQDLLYAFARIQNKYSVNA